jgi:aspergillopepsin I
VCEHHTSHGLIENRWLIGKDATGRGQHKGYDPTISGVAKRAAGHWRIEYGDGSGASGSVVYDTVAVGKVAVRQQAVELANVISSVFVTDNADGLLGLALTKINQVKPSPQTTFFENAAPILADPVFSVHLKKKAAGSYDFGFIDNTKYEGPLHWIDVDVTSGFWQFESKSYIINGQTVPYPTGRAIIGKQPRNVIISHILTLTLDTGTTLLLAPSAIVKQYYASVPGATQDDAAGGYVFPCSAKLPPFAVSVGNYHAYIPTHLLNFNQVSKTNCFGGLQAQPQLPGVARSIFGDVLLKAYFAAFQISPDGKHKMAIAKQVGIAS